MLKLPDARKRHACHRIEKGKQDMPAVQTRNVRWTNDAFAPRVNESSPGYEAYYIVLSHGSSGRALWLRYTRLNPVRGKRQGPVGAIWASFFEAGRPQRHACNALMLPFEIVAEDRPPAGANAWLSPGRMVGAVETPQGRLSWDLHIEGELGVYQPLPLWLTRLPIGGSKDIVLDARATARGSVTLGSERMNFDGARGAPHHMWGTRLSREIYYSSTPQFDGDEEGWGIETVSVRPDPFSPLMSWATISRPGEVLSSASLWRMMTGSCQATYPALQSSLRGADFSLQFKTRLEESQITSYRFRDPDGKTRYVEQSDICPMEVQLNYQGRIRHLRSRAGGVVEFHRSSGPWSDRSHCDPYGELFKD
ncbi:MAG: hypothetical protein K1X75_17805 [Leptospirales bacterium]|nr:hypothetical protein [Leptospirales bacterium]